jgi:hypothetical protein
MSAAGSDEPYPDWVRAFVMEHVETATGQLLDAHTIRGVTDLIKDIPSENAVRDMMTAAVGLTVGGRGPSVDAVRETYASLVRAARRAGVKDEGADGSSDAAVLAAWIITHIDQIAGSRGDG